MHQNNNFIWKFISMYISPFPCTFSLSFSTGSFPYPTFSIKNKQLSLMGQTNNNFYSRGSQLQIHERALRNSTTTSNDIEYFNFIYFYFREGKRFIYFLHQIFKRLIHHYRKRCSRLRYVLDTSSAFSSAVQFLKSCLHSWHWFSHHPPFLSHLFILYWM